MNCQEAIKYIEHRKELEAMPLSPMLEGKIARVEAYEIAISAMQELQDIKSQMDDNLQAHISELRQAKFDIESFWEEPTALSKALQIAINALVDIQQYKRLGTVEDIKNLSSMEIANFNALQKYRAIGTLEEVRAAMEKQKYASCETCMEKGKCAIYDNFNIGFCSDWRTSNDIFL